MMMSTVLSSVLALLMSTTSVFAMASLGNLPNNQRFFSGRDHRPKTSYRLSKPLIGDDGRVYACSERNLFAFENNGTIAWTAHLNFTCNTDIAPVRGDIGKVYLVAENRVLKVEFSDSVTSGEVFFGPEPGQGEEIIGISVSRLSSTVYINVKNRAVFAYAFHRQLLWSIGPVLNLYGYVLGCRKNPRNCYFSSVPVIDYCESQIYISNTEGEIYALSTLNPRFTWIQDLSSLCKVFTITAGNNGRVYVTVPTRSLVLALDVSTGNILWQKSVGPLSTLDCTPVVDSNGFVSVGSLDGWLYSISPFGVVKRFAPKGFSESIIQVSPILDCSGYGIYISQTLMERKISQVVEETTYVTGSSPKSAALTLLVPATSSIYWSETYSGEFSSSLTESDLRHFVLDERILLAFVASAKKGNPLHCRSNWQKLASSCSEARPKHLSIYTGSGRPTLVFLLFETAFLIVLAVLVRFCLVFWRKRKPRAEGLGSFLEKRRSLLRKKKVLDRTITELKQKATEEAVANDVIEELGNLVQGRETINKKLSTTYSLGRDGVGSGSNFYSLPLYSDNAKMRSYSFQDARKGNVTIFHTMSNSSSSSSTESQRTSDYSNRETVSSTSSIEEDSFLLKDKGKEVVVEDESSRSLVSSSSSSGGAGMSFMGKYRASPSKPETTMEMTKESLSDMAESKRYRRNSMWLNRRKAMSSTN